MVFLYALFPVAILILFIYFADKYQHEPWSQIFKAVGAGAVSALLVVHVLELLNFEFDQSSLVGSFLDAFVNAAIPEESAKLLMLWLVLRNNRYYDEYFDGVVYAVCVSMGFAGIENVVYLIEDEDWLSVGLARGVISVPAHFLFAVAMGYYYSLVHFGYHGSEKDANFNKLCVIGMPVLLHGAYDACLMALGFSFTVSVMCIIVFLATCVFMVVFAFKKCRKLHAIDKAYFDQLAQQQMNDYWEDVPPLNSGQNDIANHGWGGNNAGGTWTNGNGSEMQ